MEITHRSTQEEPESKKAKMSDNEDEDVPTLLKEETEVDVDQGNVQVPLLATEGKKDMSVALDDKSDDGEARPLDVEEGKDVSVQSDDVKVKEVSLSELGDVEVSLECEERKGALVSINADPEQVPALELEEREEVDIVSADADMKKVPVLELEEKKDASILSVDANRNEIPLMESVEKNDGCATTGGIKEDNDSHSSEKSSSASFSVKKLLVLDLNGLLVDIVSPPPKDHVSDTNIGRRAIFKRPFYEDFLKFCFEKFTVGIWSSRKQKNVDKITEYLLGDKKSKLLFCWGDSWCATSTVGCLENKYKYVVFKDLKRLWEEQDPDVSWKKGDYNETNTVLLDDSPYKALLNPPYTAIFPHSYDYTNKTDSSLGDGGDLRLYLEKLAEADNVQEFIKNHPFGQEPITKASESWEFYSQIIDKLQS